MGFVIHTHSLITAEDTFLLSASPCVTLSSLSWRRTLLREHIRSLKTTGYRGGGGLNVRKLNKTLFLLAWILNTIQCARPEFGQLNKDRNQIKICLTFDFFFSVEV